MGWLLVDGICEAFPSNSYTYTGPCAPFANLENFTDHEKKIFSELCQVYFCDTSAAEEKECDYSQSFEKQLCPDGWVHVGSLVEYCYGDAYQGPCRPLVSRSELESIGKSNFM